MRALVTGATGFIGRHLLRRLDRPVVLSRFAERTRHELAEHQPQVFAWNPTAEPPPAEAFRGVDAVFHLAGESVAAGRWTKARMARIRESRVAGSRHLVEALDKLTERPKVLVSASAVGYYGSRGEEVLTEESPPEDDFLAEVCRAWEREAMKAQEFGVRVVTPRIGVVLGRGGGALQKMLTPFRLGLGGPLGSGKQWMPWIHVEDLVRLLIFAAEHENLRGPVNAVAPGIVRNKEFTKTLGRTLHRPAFLPAPYVGLRLLFGRFAKVLFASQRVEPRAATAAGFEFRFPNLGDALADILGSGG